MARRRPQFYLADLVAITALAGLALALARSFGQSGTPVGIIVLMGLVFIAWRTFRVMREAPVCDKCGRRFVQRIKEAVPPVCSQCGQIQRDPRRSRKNLAIANWAVLGVFLLAIAVNRLPPMAFLGAPTSFIPWIALYIALPLGMMLFLMLFVGLIVARLLQASDRFKPVPCEKCGNTVPPAGATGPLICPRCRLGYPPRTKLQQEQTRQGRNVLAVLLALLLLAGYSLPNLASSHLGINYWIALPLVIAATTVGFLAALIVVLVVLNLFRIKHLTRESFILASARKASGEEGEVVRSGPATVWYSGPTDPAPLLMEQMEAARSRLESLLGREIVSQSPPRILCFRKRNAFEAFLKPLTGHVLNLLKTLDGIFIPRPYRILAICTEEVPYRVLDTDKTACALFCSYFFLETAQGDASAVWLQRGIARTLNSEPDDRARLNRKMLVSLARGNSFATDLFTFNGKEIMTLLKGLSDHRHFERYQQFSAESWSMFEYLGGEQAPAERRDRFRAFLNDNQSKEQPEEVFKRHFGIGLGPLVESWREWVQEQGIGTFTPLRPFIQDGLLNRLVPLIADRQAKREDRILAIRNMGIEGYAPGADVLIGLLQGDDAIPREEVVWALEAISGMPYGDDHDRWAAWWSGLPDQLTEGSATRGAMQ